MTNSPAPREVILDVLDHFRWDGTSSNEHVRDQLLSALTEAGLVIVPVEPTEATQEVSHEEDLWERVGIGKDGKYNEGANDDIKMYPSPHRGKQ